MWKTQQLLDSRMWRFLLLTPGTRHSQDLSRTSKSMWKVKHNPTPRIPLSVRCFTRHHFMCECVKWNGDFQKCSTLRTSRYLCNDSPKASRQPWWLFLQKLCGIQGQLSKLVIFGTSWGTPGTFSWTPNTPSEMKYNVQPIWGAWNHLWSLWHFRTKVGHFWGSILKGLTLKLYCA